MVQQLTDLVDLHNKYCCRITLAEFSQVLLTVYPTTIYSLFIHCEAQQHKSCRRTKSLKYFKENKIPRISLVKKKRNRYRLQDWWKINAIPLPYWRQLCHLGLKCIKASRVAHRCKKLMARVKGITTVNPLPSWSS